MTSRLKLLNLSLLVAAGAFGLPLLSHAKTVTFEEQTWEVSGTTGRNATTFAIRNSLPLLDVARQTFALNSSNPTAPLLSNADAAIILKLAGDVKQPVREPKLTIRNNWATSFEPGQDGRGVDLYRLRQLMLTNKEQIDLPVVIVPPLKSLADTNTLGITELVAVGESNFTGSPRNRVHNVSVGADKFNGLIIAPGEEFSFNKFLGDVDAENGFLPELVIKSGSLIPEFGGGLCQVSSTTFRAAMNAGLPITARRNHSFAVQYYAPQGTDATIYPGSVDFKFVNNLSSHLLMRTRIEDSHLYFEFYGTKDKREVAFEGPVVYDKKTDGSMKTTWTRHVTTNGSVTTQVFNSTYQPPALFKRVTTEQSSTPNPQAETPPPTEESATESEPTI